jgi:glycosyltransferase involved in cell wall biosynthesis
MIDFTIVTPSYNYGHFIKECLVSVEQQEGVTFEHLIFDACSDDNTALVVDDFSHATWIQEPDEGMTDAINKGFQRAKGRWVMWLNADDRLKHGALLAVKEWSENHPSADVIFGCWNFIDVDGKFIRRMTLFPFIRAMAANHGCYIASTSTFYRRETTISEGYYLNPKFGTVMDGEYYCRLAAAGKKLEYLPRVLADFRLHDQSISQKNIGVKGIEGNLANQLQYAEARAIHRTYGVNLFKDEMLNGLVEGVVYQIFRLIKGGLRLIYAGRTIG